jgi:hypothetical protein
MSGAPNGSGIADEALSEQVSSLRSQLECWNVGILEYWKNGFWKNGRMVY